MVSLLLNDFFHWWHSWKGWWGQKFNNWRMMEVKEKWKVYGFEWRLISTVGVWLWIWLNLGCRSLLDKINFYKYNISGMITNILRIVHSIIIVGLICRIVNGEICTPVIFGAEVGLTLIRALLERRLLSRHTKFQIIASMVLGYIMFPNKARFISWIYLIKGI